MIKETLGYFFKLLQGFFSHQEKIYNECNYALVTSLKIGPIP